MVIREGFYYNPRKDIICEIFFLFPTRNENLSIIQKSIEKNLITISYSSLDEERIGFSLAFLEDLIKEFKKDKVIYLGE